MQRIGLREPTEYELAIFERLMTATFSGRDAVREQLQNCEVRTIDKEGSIKIISRTATKASVTYRVPVEGTLIASDGLPMEFLLHVIDGRVDELEVIEYGKAKASALTLSDIQSMKVIGKG